MDLALPGSDRLRRLICKNTNSGTPLSIFYVSYKDIANRTFNDLSRIPIVDQCDFTTTIGNTKYLVLVDKVLNQDKNFGRIIYLQNLNNAKKYPTDWEEAMKQIKSPTYVPKNPDQYYLGNSYYADYWLKHADEMTKIINDFEASSSFEITPDFSQYFWGLDVISPI